MSKSSRPSSVRKLASFDIRSTPKSPPSLFGRRRWQQAFQMKMKADKGKQ